MQWSTPPFITPRFTEPKVHQISNHDLVGTVFSGVQLRSPRFDSHFIDLSVHFTTGTALEELYESLKQGDSVSPDILHITNHKSELWY
jgi:hypothetical protein